MKKVLRIIIILVSILVVGFLSLVAIYFIQKKPLYYTSYENANAYSVGSFSYDAQTIDEVNVTWISGTVQFKQASGNVLNVKEEDGNLAEKQRMRWQLDGRTLRIQYWASNYGTDKDLNKTLTVEIPDGINLHVEVKKGAIMMGSHHLKHLNAQITSTGDVEAEALVIEQECILNDTAGNLHIRSVTAQEARVSSKLGETRIDNLDIQGQLEMTSVWGTLKLGTVKAEEVKIEKYEDVQMGLDSCKAVDIKMTKGNINLTLKRDLGATVDFSTGSGKLNGKIVRDSDQTVIGDGSCKIKVDVSMGNLTVK
ncbi:MAG: DUF4097 family beta strand repeat protein [Clostridia bacterium]|nr:DUF4097 family beta strand repeat protein [Clostridia bacterium]